MINATVDIANAGRQMKRKEIDLVKSHGQDPVEHVVGNDVLAVGVGVAGAGRQVGSR